MYSVWEETIGTRSTTGSRSHRRLPGVGGHPHLDHGKGSCRRYDSDTPNRYETGGDPTRRETGGSVDLSGHSDVSRRKEFETRALRTSKYETSEPRSESRMESLVEGSVTVTTTNLLV